MISSAIWDKSARVNFSKANQFVVFEKCTSADLSQIAREKSCDYLLIIHIQKTSLQLDDKQGVFGRLPFRIVVKTLRSCQAL